jgi:hypothetical protein
LFQDPIQTPTTRQPYAFPGFDHRAGHCVVLHMTGESVHASCLRC